VLIIADQADDKGAALTELYAALPPPHRAGDSVAQPASNALLDNADWRLGASLRFKAALAVNTSHYQRILKQ